MNMRGHWQWICGYVDMWISASVSALITKSEAGAEQTECQHQMRSGSGCGGPYIYRGRSCGGASWRPMHMPVGQPHGNCVSVIPIRLPEPRCIVCHVKHCHLSKVDARGSPGKQLVLVGFGSPSGVRALHIAIKFCLAPKFAHWNPARSACAAQLKLFASNIVAIRCF